MLPDFVFQRVGEIFFILHVAFTRVELT